MKKKLIVILSFIIIAIVIISIIVCFKNNSIFKNNIKEVDKNQDFKEENNEKSKDNEKEKLRKYLLEKGYIEIEENEFKLVYRQINDKNGKPYNWDIVYFSLNNLKIEELTALSQLGINSTQDYYYLTNTASGTYSYFSSNGDLTNIVKYSYDFNTGSLTCSDNQCSSYQQTAQNDKQLFLSIIANADVDLNYLK